MDIENLNQAIIECNNGQLIFNLGHNRAFLYENKWYPLRATVNRASEIAHGSNNMTTDRALVQLVYSGLWTRVETITFLNQFPVEMGDEEKFRELNQLASVILKMTG